MRKAICHGVWIGVLALLVSQPALTVPPTGSIPADASSSTAPAALDDMEDLRERAGKSVEVLEDIVGAPDEGVPRWLLERAECIAVIPKVVKVGFIFGGRHGKGLVSCRAAGGWSSPAFVEISGGSFGLQIGAQATDFVLIFTDRGAARRMTENKVTLGADASVSAGPVGRTAEAGTDVKLDSEIFAYSRSRGAFAGISLEGSALHLDDDANELAYGTELEGEAAIGRTGDPPAVLQPFVSALTRHVPARSAG